MNNARETISATTVISTISVALANARRCGDPWPTLAQEYLGATEVLLKKTDAMTHDLLRRHLVAVQARDEMKEGVFLLLENLADALWVKRNRDANDMLLSVISPDTPGFLMDWDIGQPADRLEVLIELLCGGTEPDIASESSLVELNKILPVYRTHCEASSRLRSQLAIVEKATESIGRAGHVQYSRLRQRMRADGFDPFEVRKVFPDIPGQSISATLG